MRVLLPLVLVLALGCERGDEAPVQVHGLVGAWSAPTATPSCSWWATDPTTGTTYCREYDNPEPH